MAAARPTTRCPNKPFPNADWDAGGLLRQAILGSNLRDPMVRDTADPGFFYSEGCVFTILGSSLTVVLMTQDVMGAHTVSSATQVVAGNGHNFAEGYQNTHFGSS